MWHRNGVKAARINRNKRSPTEGFVGIISRYGSMKTDPGKWVSEDLLSTRPTVQKLKKCENELWQGDGKDNESFVCSRNGKRCTSCVGDSGAGLWRFRGVKKGESSGFYEFYGVVSFGEMLDEALCPRGFPTMFQSTSKYGLRLGMA